MEMGALIVSSLGAFGFVQGSQFASASERSYRSEPNTPFVTSAALPPAPKSRGADLNRQWKLVHVSPTLRLSGSQPRPVLRFREEEGRVTCSLL